MRPGTGARCFEWTHVNTITKDTSEKEKEGKKDGNRVAKYNNVTSKYVW